MGDKEYVAKGVKVVWNGILDLDKVYTKAKGYFDMKMYDFNEEKYIERVKQGGKQIEIKWKATKGVSDYFKNVIEIGILIIGLNKVEFEKDGRKLTVEKGEIEFQFDAYLLKDANKDFENKDFLKKIYEIMYRKRIDEYKIDLYDAVYGLVEEVKGLLELYA